MIKELEQEMCHTENGARSNPTTGTAMLNLFAQGGACDEGTALRLFRLAYMEDEQLAVKCAFYFRDIRGGQGKRDNFRTQMAQLDTKHAKKLVKYIAEFGRWDDLYCFVGTEVEKKAFKVIAKQLEEDLSSLDSVSLLAKWLKSENTSSKASRSLATITRKHLKLSSKEYRLTLSKLRKHIGIVERKICKGKWEKVDYSTVPSQAMSKYRTAFYTHDEARFAKFLEKVDSGEAKINASTLYPAQIVSKVRMGEDNRVLNTLWNSLPDFTGGREENAIAVVDVSGSMQGTPMDVAVSLGIYLAERATGEYANKFITFSENPEMQSIDGLPSITEKVIMLKSANWGFNTDLYKTLMVILKAAVRGKLQPDKMLDKLYIISDMEFDIASKNNDTVLNIARTEFEIAGYALPKIVFWNVHARTGQYPSTMNDDGVQLVSGYSPSILKQLMQDEFLSAEDLMLEVINSDRYDKIQ